MVLENIVKQTMETPHSQPRRLMKLQQRINSRERDIPINVAGGIVIVSQTTETKEIN